MAVIFHVLKEELQRLVETESGYSKAIGALPRGTPRVQQRRGKNYLYLQYREGTRVVHKYVGAQHSEKARLVLEKVAQRRRYEKLLKETRSALKEVRKALRGKV